jgi:CTP-dependent riboflavin kinase
VGNPENKMALKIDLTGTNSSEAYFTRIFSHDHKLSCVPKYYGDSLHNNKNYIMLEYIESKIQDYLNLEPFNGKLSLRDIAL